VTLNTGPNGAIIQVPFTVTEAGSGGAAGTATAVIRVKPADSTSDIPRYAQTNGVSVIPTQATPLPAASQIALYTIVPNTTSLFYPYVLSYDYPAKASTWDTGLVVTNVGQDVFGAANAVRTIGQDGTFTIYLFPDKVTDGTNGNVRSIKSDEANFPNATLLETGGRLAQGNMWNALLSQVLSADGFNTTSNWTGYAIVVADFQFARGYAFVGQFYNTGAGLSHGYVANVVGSGLPTRVAPEIFAGH
jgi:hypothetical protein